MVGEDLRRAIVKLIRSSPTFARVFAALHAAPASKVNLVIRQATLDNLGELLGHGCGKTSVVPIDPKGEALISTFGDCALQAEEVVSHEVAHAAGAYENRIDTGVDRVCGYLGSVNAEPCAREWAEQVRKERLRKRTEQDQKRDATK